jgi:hypothetical protein
VGCNGLIIRFEKEMIIFLQHVGRNAPSGKFNPKLKNRMGTKQPVKIIDKGLITF